MIRHLVIVAGGAGARMAADWPDTPKALIPVGGAPVLQHQLALASRAGVTDVTIFAGHLAGRIIDFVGDGSRFGLNVGVRVEAAPLGDAGAVVEALDALPEQVFVLYGDVMAAVDLPALAAFHLAQRADFTTLAHPNDHPRDSDLLETDDGGQVTAIHRYPHAPDAWLPNLVNAALYAVRRDALRPFEGRGALGFTRDILPGLIARGDRVLAWRSHDYVKDMGSPTRLRQVERDWRGGRVREAADGPPRKAVFLDRDGTLNVERGYIRRPELLELIPGAGPALRRLREAGYLLVVVTNQAVIARGEASEADVARINARLAWELGEAGAYVDAIYICPHHPEGGFPGERPELKIVCDCRKPRPGMILAACRDLRIDPAASWMVGDHTRDVEAGRRAGTRTILLKTGHGGRDGAFPEPPDHVARDIGEAADLILAETLADAR